MTTIPIVMGPEGRVPTAPAVLRQQLTDAVAQIVPDYTADLPGSLIEDVASTDTYAIVALDQAVTDTIAGVTPLGANEFVLANQGAIMGVRRGTPTNTSVNVVFSGPEGYVIDRGFVVGDGTYQYRVQTPTVIASGGQSPSTYCVATVPGTWAVPANSVTQILTSVPTGTTITVNNPAPGTPSSGLESVEDYRYRVLQAYGRSASAGMLTTLKTALANVPGVTNRLVSVQQVDGGGWKVLVGGGDPYLVANAIFSSLFDITTLKPSTNPARTITVNISNPPDTYAVTYVSPDAQAVSVALTWNSISPNLIDAAAVSSLGKTALSQYVNSVPVGAPMNLFEMQAAFVEGIVSLVAPSLVTRMVFTVRINGIVVAPEAGTGIIRGDSEGYFVTTAPMVTITRG